MTRYFMGGCMRKKIAWLYRGILLLLLNLVVVTGAQAGWIAYDFGISSNIASSLALNPSGLPYVVFQNENAGAGGTGWMITESASGAWSDVKFSSGEAIDN